MFNAIIADEIRQKLFLDNPQGKQSPSGQHIRKLTCPVCGKNEAWSYYKKPLAVICPRQNKCGVITPIKELYPDIFRNLSERFPTTKDNPKATATAYLESRCLDPGKIKYSQGKIEEDGREYPSLKIKVDSETVFHRLIDYEGKNKNRIGAYSGKAWKPDTLDYSKRVWITEGIIDALSLIQSGEQAAAVLSAPNLPKKFYKEFAASNVEIVLAFDNDRAGKRAFDKHSRFFEEESKKTEKTFAYRLAIPPEDKDWNDLLIEGALDEGRREQTFEDCLWRGDLHRAKSAREYYKIHCRKHGYKLTIFEYRDQMFKGWTQSGGNEKEAIYYANLLADCSIDLLYSIRDESQPYKTETRHRLELYSKKEGKNIVECSADELSNSSHFKRLLLNQNQVFYGSLKDLSHLAEYIFAKRTPKVRQCKVLGYDKKSGCFVFPSFLYDRKGERHAASKDKYFEKQKLAPTAIKERIIEKYKKTDIKFFLETLFEAFSYRGLLSLGFWTATAFSNVIFDRFGFFPFVSMYGDTHCGKSDLAMLLNACFFVEWEGLTMSQANTIKGEIRKIAQKSSLVTPLLEGSQGRSSFDFDSILPMYNRNPPQTRARKNNGLDTNETAFEGSLAFIQNNEPFPSRAAKERVVSVHFKESDLNEDTRQAWKNLKAYSPEELAFVGHSILSARKWFEERIVKRIETASEELEKSGVQVARIAENHAIPLAVIALIMEKFDFGAEELKQGLADFVAEIAKTKMKTAKNEAPLVDLFFDCLSDLGESTPENLDKGGYRIAEDGFILLHLPTALNNIRHNFDKKELIKELKQSEHFIKDREKSKTKKLFGKEVFCWKLKNFLQ